MGLKKIYKNNQRSFFLLLWMITMPLLGSSFVTVIAVKHEAFVAELHVWHWILVYFITAFTMALALTPTTFIALAGGYFLGMQSLALMIPAYIAASVAGYFVAKLFEQGRLYNTLAQYPQVGTFLEGINKNQAGVIVFSRLSPVLPFAIMNVVLSMIGTRLSVFTWAGFLGMLPRTIFFSWIGSRVREISALLQAGESQTARLVFVVFLVVSLLGLFYYFQKILKNRR